MHGRVAAVAIVALGAMGWAGCLNKDTDIPPIPAVAPCVNYEAMMVSVDDPYTIPSIIPADFGVRIIVDRNIQPFMGASYPVPGGRMVWNVWILRWFDGEHLGAIGRGDDDACQWYGPLP